MYAYGVCVLRTCCTEGAYCFSPTGQLIQWQQAATQASTAPASAKAYASLPGLLADLLAEAPERRASATEALRHPFLDAMVEKELAQREREELEGRIAQLKSEDEQRSEKHRQQEEEQRRKLAQIERERMRQLVRRRASPSGLLASCAGCISSMSAETRSQRDQCTLCRRDQCARIARVPPTVCDAPPRDSRVANTHGRSERRLRSVASCWPRRGRLRTRSVSFGWAPL